LNSPSPRFTGSFLFGIKYLEPKGGMMAERINNFKELRVYQSALISAMEIFKFTKSFPSEEKYSLTDQSRRCSRSVCANIAEAWRKRRYKAAFISKLSDAESEAAEVQVWIEFAFRCEYIDISVRDHFNFEYEKIIKQIIRMIDEADKWLIKVKKN
jgi:four helix bundle protein